MSVLPQRFTQRKVQETMAMHDISTEVDLEGLIKENDIIVLDFWAPWCPPCKVFAEVLESVSERFPHVAFSRVNTNEEEELSPPFDVSTIPMLVVIRDRVMVASQQGYLEESEFQELLRQVEELDMESVRAGAQDQEVQERSDP
jgi:thioredoxin-like negative regulator of GroEL